MRFSQISPEITFALVLQFDFPTLVGTVTGALSSELTDTSRGGGIADIMRGGRDGDGS